MKTVRLGNSDLDVTRVILGTWALGGWMWGGTDPNEPVEAIKASLDRGVTTIDTAPIYGFGLSEELVGKAVQGRRDEVVVATKFGMRWDRDDGEFFFKTDNGPDGRPTEIYRNAKKDSIMEECEHSLRRLGVDVIDLYQCHWPDKTTPEEETMEALLTLQQQGKIRWFGVSNFDVPQMKRCQAVAPLTSLQPPYSLLQRGIEDEILPYCRQNDIGVIVYSPMYRGLLTGKFTQDYEFGPGDTRAQDSWFNGEKLDRVNRVLDEVVRPIADGHGASPAQVSVAWCLAQPGVTAALVGARNTEQAESNARAAEIDLSGEEVKRIGDAFAELK